MARRLILLAVTLILVGAALALTSRPVVHAQDPDPSSGDMVALGKALFEDAKLSASGTQSCATCHASEVGFTGPDQQINAGGSVYPGAIPPRYGNRKPPAASYAGDSPLLHRNTAGEWVGGMFWDGRATGVIMGDPLAEQAKGPYLNPLEQAVSSVSALCDKVAQSDYAALFRKVWGPGSLDCTADASGVYDRIGRSVAAFERSAEVNPFTSKFDKFWDKAAASGKDVRAIRMANWQNYRKLGLTDAELTGLASFNDPNRANCASCHSLAPGSAGYPLFTDFTYDNLGIPKNPQNPFYSMPSTWNPAGANWIDYGLGGYLKDSGAAEAIYGPQLGKFKVPTLRNVDRRPQAGFVKAYGHNGYFKSLSDIVMFYHWRGMSGGMGGQMGGGGMGGGGMGRGGMGGGMMGNMFPPPEVNQNLAVLPAFPGMDRPYLVAFMQTLTDGYYRK